MDDLTERLKRALASAFGDAASYRRLAVFSGCADRRAQHWVKGDSEPPIEVIEALEAAGALIHELDPDTAVAKLVAEWREAGLHEEQISVILARAHAEVTGRAIA